MRYRARMGLCHGPLSREPYKGDLLHYGGGKSGANEVPGKGFFALTDVEKICGSNASYSKGDVKTDLTGINTTAGQTIYAFFQNMSLNFPIKAAYMHVQYVKIVSLSSGGTVVEE